MDTRSRVIELVDQLIALFNRRSEDIPDGFFDRRTQFLLNGCAFEELLGRSPNDPLVLMLTRGPAGYRLTAKAILLAVPDARIERGEISDAEALSAPLRLQCWLSGHLRGSGEAIETVFDVEFALQTTGVVERASVTIDEAHLANIRTARLLP